MSIKLRISRRGLVMNSLINPEAYKANQEYSKKVRDLIAKKEGAENLLKILMNYYQALDYQLQALRESGQSSLLICDGCCSMERDGEVKKENGIYRKLICVRCAREAFIYDRKE